MKNYLYSYLTHRKNENGKRKGTGFQIWFWFAALNPSFQVYWIPDPKAILKISYKLHGSKLLSQCDRTKFKAVVSNCQIQCLQRLCYFNRLKNIKLKKNYWVSYILHFFNILHSSSLLCPCSYSILNARCLPLLPLYHHINYPLCHTTCLVNSSWN